MPGGDRTGPMGMGATTGRAAGYCSGSGMPGYANPGAGRGRGAHAGFGRGIHGCGWRYAGRGLSLRAWGRGWTAPNRYPTPFEKCDPELEKQALKEQSEALQSQLDYVKRRLGEIEDGSENP